MSIKSIQEKIQVYFTRPLLSNFFCGAGLFHSIYTEESYLQIPLAILFPSTYIGYHVYKYTHKNLDKIME